MPYVYLIHLDEPLGNLAKSRAQAQHYIGWCVTLEDRERDHREDRGAFLLRAANGRGIGWSVVRVWECRTARQAWNLEKKLKRRKNAPKLCPTCRGEHAATTTRASVVVRSGDVQRDGPNRVPCTTQRSDSEAFAGDVLAMPRRDDVPVLRDVDGGADDALRDLRRADGIPA